MAIEHSAPARRERLCRDCLHAFDLRTLVASLWGSRSPGRAAAPGSRW
jgi:hypothetical protein